MTAVVWLLTAVVAVLAVLVVGLLRSHATILRALHDAGIDLDPDGDGTTGGRTRPDGEPEIRTRPGVPGPAGASGQRATDLAGTTPTGGSKTVAVTSGGPTLLAFLTAGCSTCATFWDAFTTAGRNDGTAPGTDPGRTLGLPAGVRIVIVTKDVTSESPTEVAALAPPGITTLLSSQAWADYRIPMAPYFVLVDGRRGVVIGEGAAASWERVRDLLRRAMADAGLGEGRVGRRELFGGRGSERIDRDLLDAGITPGDPRLYHDGEDGP